MPSYYHTPSTHGRFNLEEFVAEARKGIGDLPVVFTADRLRAFILEVAETATKETIKNLIVTLQEGTADNWEGKVIVESAFHVRRFPVDRALDHVTVKTKRSVQAALKYRGKRKLKARRKAGTVAQPISGALPRPDLSDAIDMSEMSARLQHCLRNQGIETYQQAVAQTEKEILRTPNFGRRSLDELKEFLAWRGLSLAEEPKLHLVA